MKFLLALLVMSFCIALSACTEEGTTTFDATRPRNTDALSAAIPDNSVYLFDDALYGGGVERLENVFASAPEAMHALDHVNRASSIEWRLPPGVVVMLGEGTSGKGNQVALWGSGQVPNLMQWNVNDKLGAWGWYNIGGSNAGAMAAGISPHPPLAEPTSLLTAGTIEMFNDRDFGGTLTPINVTASTMGAFHSAGRASDQMSSIRWSLPPGVVVVLYEDAGGHGGQLALWGSGQYPWVDLFNFNDKVSDWAWYDVSGR